ncbi:melanopsin-A-like [Mytilus edulis]|uniref:melanopsin-A-like n=1 Tax=Mytilus edulis TaxID=6550 RepID=UPI0039EECC9D
MVVASCFNKVWMFGEFGCTSYAFLMTFGGLASMLLLTMISVDRYIYVVKHNLSRQQPTKPIIITLSVCLLMTFGFSISPLLGWTKYTYSGVGTSCAIDLATDYNNGQSFVITICVIYFILPVSLMIFAYGSIYVKVSKESKANLGFSRRRTFVVSRQEFQLKLTIEQELAVTITSIIGHRNYHAIHTQVIVDNEGSICYVESGYLGNQNEAQQYRMMRQIGANAPLNFPEECVQLGDIIYPNRHPVFTPLTRQQITTKPDHQKHKSRKFNRVIAEYRVLVEHAMGDLKNYKVMGTLWRHLRQKPRLIVEACA